MERSRLISSTDQSSSVSVTTLCLYIPRELHKLFINHKEMKKIIEKQIELKLDDWME